MHRLVTYLTPIIEGLGGPGLPLLEARDAQQARPSGGRRPAGALGHLWPNSVHRKAAEDTRLRQPILNRLMYKDRVRHRKFEFHSGTASRLHTPGNEDRRPRCVHALELEF